MVFFRGLPDGKHDIAVLSPLTQTVTAWGTLERFFNDTLASPNSRETLIASAQLQSAQATHGPLDPGQVYEIDPAVLPAGVLKFTRRPAIDIHSDVFRQIEARSAPVDGADTPLRDLLPQDLHETFLSELPPNSPKEGLYYAGSVGYHTLLRLDAAGRFALVYWQTDQRAYLQTGPRLYQGAQNTSHAGGAWHHSLDIVFNNESLGSDANFAELWHIQDGETHILLTSNENAHFGAMLSWDSTLPKRQDYLLGVTPASVIPYYDETPQDLSLASLPPAVRDTIHNPPTIARITEVSNPEPTAEDDEFFVKIEWNTGVPPVMNQRLCSPGEAPKQHYGWCSTVTDNTASYRINIRRDEAGKIIEWPEIGDEITTRSPTAGPF